MRERPNILFILTDQHAKRIAGCYGDAIVATPNIDMLAEQGVTFDNTYCPSPICLPSRMSMLTARHPFRQNCWHNTDILASDIPTFPQALGAAGYKPVLAGRMHSLGPDQMRGYVNRLVGDHHPNWPGKGTHTMGELGRSQASGITSLVNSGPGGQSYELHAAQIAEAACEQLEEFAADRSAPFAMTVGFMLPHNPYVARPQDYALYEGKVGEPRLPIADSEHPAIASWRKHTRAAEATNEEIVRSRTAYYANVTRTDELIGDILGRLAALGLDRDTLVIYASDHGEMLGERGLFWKSVFFEEAVTVPLVMRWPGVLPAGERRAHVVNLMDVTATIVEAAAAPPLPNSDGRSLLGIAADENHPWLDLTFSEYCTEGFLPWLGTEPKFQRMVRMGRWKLAYYHGYSPQLFDLEHDPDEQHDLAGDQRHEAVRDRLVAMVLADWDPVRIAAFMEQRKADKMLITAWREMTNPPSVHRWEMQPDQNWLMSPPAKPVKPS